MWPWRADSLRRITGCVAFGKRMGTVGYRGRAAGEVALGARDVV
jgi:hypothetical protein